MTRVRSSGSFTAVINDDEKSISIRHRRPDPNQVVIPGDAEKDQAVKAMGLEKEIDQGYEVLDDLAE